MSAAKRSTCTGVTPRRGKRCANCHAHCRKQAAISNRRSLSRTWTGFRLRSATPSRRGECKKPNESSFSPSGRRVRADENGDTRRNDGPVENEENQTQASLRFPQPVELA